MATETDIKNKESFLSAFDRKLRNREFVMQVIDRDLIKIVALLLMTLGHWAFIIFRIIPSKPLISVLISAQFFAPPVFFFFIAEGYHYTKSKTKYLQRLLIFAAITQIPHSLTAAEGFSLHGLFLQWSVLMTLAIGLAALIVLDSAWKLPVRILAVAALMGLSLLLDTEWAVGGIMIIILFSVLREKPVLRLVSFMILMVAEVSVMVGHFPAQKDFFRYLLPVWSAGLVITFLYNGKKGHFPAFTNYLFYIWYPLHLLLQWIFGILQA